MQGAKLTSLGGAEGHLAGGPQSPAVKGLHLQMVGAVGPQAAQDGAGAVGRHQHVASVDVPLAVPPLTALPPVRHLQADRRPRKGRRPLPVTLGHVFPTALPGEPSFQPEHFRESSWQKPAPNLTRGISPAPTPRTLTLYPRRWPLTWAGSTGHHLTSTVLELRILMPSSSGLAWGSGNGQ